MEMEKTEMVKREIENRGGRILEKLSEVNKLTWKENLSEEDKDKIKIKSKICMDSLDLLLIDLATK